MARTARRVRIFVRRILRTADSPRRTAAAFSLGVFIGLSPFLGAHTLLALALAFLLRLNRLAVLLGTFVLNPWTLLPLYSAGTWVGLLLLGERPQAPPPPVLEGATGSPAAAVAALGHLGPYLAPFLVGNLVLGALAAAFVFPVALVLVGRFRRLREERRRSRRAAPTAPLADAPRSDPS